MLQNIRGRVVSLPFHDVNTDVIAPNEFRAAVVAGISALSKDIEKALPKVRDAATAVHLRDLAARLSQ